MKQIIIGMVILTILLITGVVAEESNTTPVATNGSEKQWTISPEASLALVKVCGADLSMIEDAYGYLLIGNESEKEGFKEIAEDTNGSIHALLATVESSTDENETASADMLELYVAWDSMNASAYQMISSYEGNNSVPVSADVLIYEQAALNTTQVYDKLVSRYVDKNTIDQDFFILLLYLDLLNSINAQRAYVLTANPVEKELYYQKMDSFDTNAELFMSRFPDVSIENLKEMKKNLDDIVQITSFDTIGIINEEKLTALENAITDIMSGYSQASLV